VRGQVNFNIPTTSTLRISLHDILIYSLFLDISLKRKSARLKY
jgi:hypothetical protein